MKRVHIWAILGCWLALGAGAHAEMTYSGVVLNSGEAGASLVDFVGVREAPWAYTSDAMDGVFVDKDGSVWAAGANGVGEQRQGFVYKYSPQGRVLARYALGAGRWLGSKIAADERYLYFLGVRFDAGKVSKTPLRLDRTVPPPGPGAQKIPVEGLALIHWSLDQMAGHLYQGKLYVSSNGADPGTTPGKIVAIDGATGAQREVLAFPPDPTGKTDWVQVVDVDPNTGTIYLMRHVQRQGGPGVHGLGDQLCEAYDQQGKRTAGFVKMHVYPYLVMSSWTPAGLFTMELVPDARFGSPAEELADFVTDPSRYLVGNINQVAVDGKLNVYAAGSTGRNISVFSPQGQPIARIGALLTTAVAAGPRGELWFLTSQGGLAQGLADTRSSELVAKLSAPEAARPETPPEMVGQSYADVTDVRSLVATPEGWYYRLVRRNEQGKVAPNWEIRMGTSEGRPNPRQAVGKFAPEALTDPGQMCLLETAPGKRALLLPDAAQNRVLNVPLFGSSTDLSPTPLTLKGPGGAELAIDRPRAVAVDDQGRLLVACAQAVYRLQPAGESVYTLDWSARMRQYAQGRQSDLVALAASGDSVFVADAGRHVVYRLDATGEVVEQFGVAGEPGTAADHLDTPHSLAIIGDFLYVADTGNLRVVRLRTR